MDVYMVRIIETGRYYCSGRNNTVATFTNIGSAKAVVTRMGSERCEVVKITDVEKVIY